VKSQNTRLEKTKEAERAVEGEEIRERRRGSPIKPG